MQALLLALGLLAGASASAVSEGRTTVVADPAGAELDAYLSGCAAFGFSGCVLVQRKGELLLRKGYGLADPSRGIPNTPETLFDIASISKPVTAAAILKLEAQGRLDTDDSIAKHLADVPEEHAEVTLLHLLTHTSGFPRHGPGGTGALREAALATYLSGHRVHDAGERFEYYNGGYALLAGVVERVTGEPFEDWVRSNLFEPAGLVHTDFAETLRMDRAGVAVSHDTRKPATDYIRGWGYKGMGGVLTSVSDLALWCAALFEGELLPLESLERMVTPYRDDYALGWYAFDTERGRRVVQHGGTAPGFQSYLRHFPAEEVTILVLTNREGWHWQVAWGLSAALLDEDPKAPAPPEPFAWEPERTASLTGTWESGDDVLVLRPDPGGAPGLILGALGREVVTALHPSARGRTSRKGASSRDLDRARERAEAIVAELREGRCELLGEDLLPHIPKSWPDRVLQDLWPKHVARFGAVREHRAIGAFFDPATGRTRVWVHLDQEQGTRALEVAFVGRSLNIFDLKAPLYPVEVPIAPVAHDRLVGFDFTEEPPYELRVKSKGKRLELRTRDGTKLTFRPAR